jgi:hypothetical protein
VDKRGLNIFVSLYDLRWISEGFVRVQNNILVLIPQTSFISVKNTGHFGIRPMTFKDFGKINNGPVSLFLSWLSTLKGRLLCENECTFSVDYINSRFSESVFKSWSTIRSAGQENNKDLIVEVFHRFICKLSKLYPYPGRCSSQRLLGIIEILYDLKLGDEYLINVIHLHLSAFYAANGLCNPSRDHEDKKRSVKSHTKLSKFYGISEHNPEHKKSMRSYFTSSRHVPRQCLSTTGVDGNIYAFRQQLTDDYDCLSIHNLLKESLKYRALSRHEFDRKITGYLVHIVKKYNYFCMVIDSCNFPVFNDMVILSVQPLASGRFAIIFTHKSPLWIFAGLHDIYDAHEETANSGWNIPSDLEAVTKTAAISLAPVLLDPSKEFLNFTTDKKFVGCVFNQGLLSLRVLNRQVFTHSRDSFLSE